MKKIILFFAVILIATTIFAQPTIDGSLTDGDYQSIGTSSGRDGFGSGNNINSLKYYTNGTDIYIAIEGVLNSNNNIVLFFNFSGYGGRGSNTLAGSSTSSSGVFTTTSGGLDGATMDMDVDFAFAFNEGTGTSNLYMDAARFGSGSAGYIATGFVGSSNQSGTPATLNPNSVTGGTGNMTLAYTDGNGLEFKIPIAAFSGVTNAQQLQLFAIITNNIGFMSNETIPGDPGASNLGNDSNLSGISGQDFFTSSYDLPVELLSLQAKGVNNSTELSWSTSSERNNSHFEIERSADSRNWPNIGEVKGNDTEERVNNYTFRDERPLTGMNYYRLKQVDFNGAYEYSKAVSVRFNDKSINISLSPNPVADQLTIQGINTENGIAEILDQSGKVLMTLQNATSANVSALVPGTYILRYQSETGEISMSRFVKK